MEELQLDAIRKQTKDVLRELMEKADLKQGQILVVAVPPVKSGALRLALIPAEKSDRRFMKLFMRS